MKLATLCYIQKDNKTLMLHRVKKEDDMHQGKWNGLGGKLEPGESPEECVIREVREECGLTLRNPILKGIMTFPQFSKGEDWWAFIFIAREFEGSLKESSEGDLEWIDNDKLFDLDLWDGDKIFIEWLKKKGFFSAKFIYKDGKLTKHSVVFYK